MGINFTMAWRNVWRNPRRSILTMSAIAFACILLVFMLSWQLGSYDTMINSSVKIHTGHIQVQAQGYNDKRSIRLVVSDPKEIAALLQEMPAVEHYTFRANAFSLASSEDRTYGIMVIGIDPVKEARISTLKETIRHGSYLMAGDSNQAILGEMLAENLHVGLDDEVVILGQGRDGSVAATVMTVRGLYRSGQDDFDRSTMHIGLSTFQDVFAMQNSVHEVVVLCRSLEQVASVKDILKNDVAGIGRGDELAVLDWEELIPGLIQVIQMDLVSGLIFYFILIVVVAFSILNTFLMSLFERTREFGVLLAIGTTPGRLMKLLLLESLTMTAIGIVMGIIIGSIITLYFQNHGILISGASDLMRQYGIPDRMYPRLSLASILIGPAAVFVITFLTATYPALKIRRLRPVKAMGG